MDQNPRLIIIPLVHTPADMGNLQMQVPSGEEDRIETARYWEQVFSYVRGLPFEFSDLKVYQDSLADTSTEIVEKIVNETQTPNFDVLRWIREKGASIIGTENPSLLVEERQSLQAIFNSPDEVSKQAARLDYFKKSFWLLDERDRYIAQRISQTLGRGIGILFIGAAHNVEGFLPKEVEVSKPEIETSLPLGLRRVWGKEGE